MPRSGWNISMVTLNNVHNRHSISGRGHIASKLYFISCLCLVIFSKSLSSAFSGRFSPLGTDGFHAVQEQRALGARSTRVQEETHNDVLEISPIRREMICSAAGMLTAATIHQANTQPASAEIGTLPEFADTNAIVQGITVNVADESQKDTMIRFLENAFDFKTLRRRIRGTVDETWLGFGPEQVSIPETFQLPVSSFGEYGGHASINVRYDSSITTPFYRQGDDAPGTNIAYLQLGVPGYRISQMVANGGKILDAYGLVNVVSPAGLPIRGIVGISPDPIMFLAVNCKDVKVSKEFYEKLGFVEQEVPYSRPSKGTTIFEPAPPKGSCYMSPSPNCMGVLLLPSKQKKDFTPNLAVKSLNIVYKPSSDGESGNDLVLNDPSSIPIEFQSVSDFSATEKMTR